MLTLESIKERLKDRNLKAVATAAGLHYNAVYRFVNGQVSPSYATVKKLSDYLEGEDAKA